MNIMEKETFTVLNNEGSYQISVIKPEFEFIGINPAGNLEYKEHHIKCIDEYTNLYNTLKNFIYKYPNLTYNKDGDYYIEHGINDLVLSKNLIERWIHPKHISVDSYKNFNLGNMINSSLLMLPYEKTDYYNYCFFNKIIINSLGELLIKVLYKNNGSSLFGTLNAKYEIYNLRDIDNKDWFTQLIQIIEQLDDYLADIKYDDKFSA